MQKKIKGKAEECTCSSKEKETEVFPLLFFPEPNQFHCDMFDPISGKMVRMSPLS